MSNRAARLHVPADLEADLVDEVVRQDVKHGRTFAADTALGRIRLGIACVEDEVAETLEAWRDEKRELLRSPYAIPMPWSRTRAEALQVAAVALRLVRQIDAEEARA